MYKDLADAVESLKENGFTHTYELGDDYISCKELDIKFSASELTIVETHSFNQGTDPGSESTVYAIKSDKGVKGILIMSYGMYVDKSKASLIDQLLKTQR